VQAAGRQMLEIMKKISGGFREGLPLDIETASKTGELPGARGETGVVYLEGRPFVLSVMSAFISAAPVERHSETQSHPHSPVSARTRLIT
jgi:beta-lactamase class A